jgi:hypothetical protein
LGDEKRELPAEEVRDHVSRDLEGYFNGIWRSLKCVRDKDMVGARLEASRCILFLLEVRLGIEGRIASYYKFLGWELAKYPLERLEIQGRRSLNI